jgi:hypothetical protein
MNNEFFLSSDRQPDKGPDEFFSTLLQLSEEGLPFELTVLGKEYRDLPPIMMEAKERLAAHIVHWGYLMGDEYANALAASDVVSL